MKIKKGKDYVTRDYSKFSFMPKGNRHVWESHVKKMAHKITTLDLTSFGGIICYKKGKKFFILDGQHRFEACKRLNKPIHYNLMTNKKAIALFIQQLNSGSKPHNAVDRLKIQRDFGCAEARKVYNIWRTYGKKVGMSQTVACQLLFGLQPGGSANRALERGTFKVKYLKEFKELHKFIDSLPLADWKWRSSFVMVVADVFKLYKGSKLKSVLRKMKSHKWVKERNVKDYRQQYLDVHRIDLQNIGIRRRRVVC